MAEFSDSESDGIACRLEQSKATKTVYRIADDCGVFHFFAPAPVIVDFGPRVPLRVIVKFLGTSQVLPYFIAPGISPFVHSTRIRSWDSPTAIAAFRVPMYFMVSSVLVLAHRRLTPRRIAGGRA